MTEYNYASFPTDMQGPDFESFRNRMHVGDVAPEGELIEVASGLPVKLSEYRGSGPLVIEFGSIT